MTLRRFPRGGTPPPPPHSLKAAWQLRPMSAHFRFFVALSQLFTCFVDPPKSADPLRPPFSNGPLGLSIEPDGLRLQQMKLQLICLQQKQGALSDHPRALSTCAVLAILVPLYHHVSYKLHVFLLSVHTCSECCSAVYSDLYDSWDFCP